MVPSLELISSYTYPYKPSMLILPCHFQGNATLNFPRRVMALPPTLPLSPCSRCPHAPAVPTLPLSPRSRCPHAPTVPMHLLPPRSRCPHAPAAPTLPLPAAHRCFCCPRSRCPIQPPYVPLEAVCKVRCLASWGHRDMRTSHCMNGSGDVGTWNIATDISLYERQGKSELLIAQTEREI